MIDAIIKNDYESLGIFIEPGEVFISDGAKSDCGNIGDMLRHDNSIGVTDPVYPVYIDSNVMAGRTGICMDGKWTDVVYIPCTAENQFVPQLPSRRVDIIYLCYPNNPTGTTLTKDQLKKWVNYALDNDAIIMYDSAYEAYIKDANIPHSIYEIKGAKKVAIEFPQLFQDGWFHRRALWLHCCPERVESLHIEWRSGLFEQTLAASPIDQVQWNELYHATGSRSGVFTGRKGANLCHDRLLYEECFHHERGIRAMRTQSLWRNQCTISLGEGS